MSDTCHTHCRIHTSHCLHGLLLPPTLSSKWLLSDTVKCCICLSLCGINVTSAAGLLISFMRHTDEFTAITPRYPCHQEEYLRLFFSLPKGCNEYLALSKHIHQGLYLMRSEVWYYDHPSFFCFQLSLCAVVFTALFFSPSTGCVFINTINNKVPEDLIKKKWSTSQSELHGLHVKMWQYDDIMDLWCQM